MGHYDFLKKKVQVERQPEPQINEVVPSIAESEKRFYQPDEYYTPKTHDGTVFERTVVTFEQRKKTCIPSERGLYVAEILLLEYCTYGKYPRPKNGYPGFWWFEYGIRDVAVVLKSLEERRYIQFSSPKRAIEGWKIADLKELLQKYDAPTNGKKADLVARVQKIISDEELIEAGVECKYELTELGQKELEDNGYVAYMHKHPHKTTDDSGFGSQFNVWSINKILGCGDKSNWKEAIDRIEQEIKNKTEDRHTKFMEDIKKIDPQGFDVLKAQDEQLKLIKKAEAKYEADKDIDFIINFWETLWENGGLKFEGSLWHFRLADLYIGQKRYYDALTYCEFIKETKKNYAEKADRYIQRIEENKAKITPLML